MENKTWKSAQVRNSIWKKIYNIIQQKVDPTITNVTQFTDLALREKLEKLEGQQMNHKTEVKA